MQAPVTPLVTSPVYPNSVLWSEDNLLAVAAGHLIFIINPSCPSRGRGIIVLPQDVPFPIGVVQREDLLSACLLPSCLSREILPCARSISWSPLGLASNRCLLAVCTTEGRAKIYHASHEEPYIEWTEMLDISDYLCAYYARCNFMESNTTYLDFNQELSFSECHGVNNLKKASKEELPLISSREYAYRKTLMSSLIVAWSPTLELRSGSSPGAVDGSCTRYTILALGGKSGHISFWKISEPVFDIQKAQVHVQPILLEVLSAHKAWITSITWEICRKDALKPQLVLVTGSSDGSVKLWVRNIDVLTTSTETAGFSLLKELIPVTHVPISLVSVIATEGSHDDIVLAVGKCSGSLETWKCDISSCSFESLGIFSSHDQAITGLGWAYNGRYLYSCGMDNSLQSWVLHGNSYTESHFQRTSPMLRHSSNVIQLSNPSFGLAVSPGNLIISLVLTLDPNQLDPMYEAKSQKAAIEFLWISGQPLDVLDKNNGPDCNMDDMLDLPERELLFWKGSLLQSLKQYESTDKQLVIWDAVFALMLLKQHHPSFVHCLLSQWLTGWLSSSYSDATVQGTLSCLCSSVSQLNIRKLHLLNIIGRRLMLADRPGVDQNEIQRENDVIDYSQTEIMNLWSELAVRIEREIRERLVAFAFKAFLTVAAASSTSSLTDVWLPSGIAQMEQWVFDNLMLVSSDLKLLASKISEPTDRVYSFDGYRKEETCTICSAVVPFESPEVAVCRPENPSDDDSAKRQRLDHGSVSLRPCSATRKSHELRRCSATMQICSISPLWHCSCCKRSAEKLLPEEFFTASVSPLDVKFQFSLSCSMRRRKPCCPFCGVLLQRLCGFSVSATTV